MVILERNLDPGAPKFFAEHEWMRPKQYSAVSI